MMTVTVCGINWVVYIAYKITCKGAHKEVKQYCSWQNEGMNNILSES